MKKIPKEYFLGKTFGRLTVLSEEGRNSEGRFLFSCLCICGKEKVITGKALKSGRTKSCGCLSIETTIKNNLVHGGCDDPLYDIWNGIQQRIHYENHIRFNRYGGRGLTCEFKDFADFRDFVQNELGPKPSESHTLDRKDNDGNYSRENLRYASPLEQVLNRSLRKDKTSKFRGVHKDKNKWVSTIGIPGKASLYLGRFINELEAAEVFLQKYFEVHKKWPPEHSDTPLCYKSPLIYKGLICV